MGLSFRSNRKEHIMSRSATTRRRLTVLLGAATAFAGALAPASAAPGNNPYDPANPNSPSLNAETATGTGQNVGVGGNSGTVNSAATGSSSAGGDNDASAPDLGKPTAGVFPENDGSLHIVVQANDAPARPKMPIIPAGQ
jgi:hypothetical protein